MEGTTRPRLTGLLSATRRDTYGESPYGLGEEMAPLTQERADLAAFAIRERRESRFHGLHAARLRYDD